MKLKAIFLLIALISVKLNTYGQVTMRYQPQGGVVTNYQTRHIISDFGWRTLGWHKGIDLNVDGVPSDEGYHIISPVGGIVSFLDYTGYKIITVDGIVGNNNSNRNFGYGHIFNNRALPIQVNDFVLLRLDGLNSNYCAILNIATGIAISNYNGGNGTVTWPRVNGTQYAVTNNVDLDQPIAPIGGSGGFGSPIPNGYQPHVHLYLAINPTASPDNLANSKDPLQLISTPHPRTSYDITIEPSNLTSLSENTYFNGSDQSSIKVRCTMQNIGNNNQPLGQNCDTYYESAVMDLDDVLLFAKRIGSSSSPQAEWGVPGSNVHLFQGLRFKSKLSHGARLGEGHDRYPSPGNPATNVNVDIALLQGNSQRSGIAPTAYCGAEYDEFYFSDIYTRISKSDMPGDGQNDWASINYDARYPDGDYELFVMAIDVNSSSHTSELNSPKTIVIDNFRPYIEKLEISNPTGNPIYTYEWRRSGNNLVLHEGGSGAAIDPFYPVTINFWSSEPLNDGGVIAGPVVRFGDKVAAYKQNTNGTAWKYEFSENSLSQAELHSIVISGTDLNGNQLIDMPDAAGTIPLANMPVRTGNSFSNPDNLTDNETTSVVGCYTAAPAIAQKSSGALKSTSSGCNPPPGESPFPIPSFTVAISGADNNVVSFTNTSQFGSYYFWEFGDGEVSYDKNPAPHIYPVEYNSKSYNVSLSLTNEDGQTKVFNTNVLIQGSNTTPSLINIAGGYSNPAGLKYDFNYSISGGEPGYTYKYEMDFGDGNITIGATGGLYSHTYEQSFIPKTFFPELLVKVYEGEENLGEYKFNYTPISVDGLPELDLEITYELETSVPNNAITPRSEFKLKANVINGKGKHTFVWEVYNKDILNMSVNDRTVYHKYTNVGVDEILHTFDKEGEYLIRLKVNDQFGHFGSKEFIANVVKDYGCAELEMFIQNCASQFKVAKNHPVRFSVAYLLHNCAEGANDNAGLIKWYMNGPDGKTSLGCESIPSVAGLPTGGINTVKCISFPEAGTYEVTAEVYPYDTYHYPPDNNHYIGLRNDYLSAITKTVIVEDCDDTKNLDFGLWGWALVKKEIKSGTVSINNPPFVIQGYPQSFPLRDGDELTLIANKEVVIKPPFIAGSGSSFNAKIEPCPTTSCVGCMPDYSCNSTYAYYKVPKEAIHVSISNSWCNVGKGAYKYRFWVDDAYGGPYWGNLSVNCYSVTDCNYENAPNPGAFCSSGCSHSNSLRTGVAENAEQTNNYFHALKKKEVFASVRLGWGLDNSKWSAPTKVGCLIANNSKDAKDEFNLANERYDVHLFPNPVSNKFTMEIHGDYTETQLIEIYNQIGQKVYIKEDDFSDQNEVDIANWPYGIYIVRVVNEKGEIITKKLIKE